AHGEEGDHVGVIAEPRHRTRFPVDARHRRLVEPLGADDGERDLAVETEVGGQVDALLAALAEDAGDLVTPTRERRPYRHRRGAGRERHPAAAAELVARLAACTAGRTALAELCPAAPTVLALVADELTAGRAAHGRPWGRCLTTGWVVSARLVAAIVSRGCGPAPWIFARESRHFHG